MIKEFYIEIDVGVVKALSFVSSPVPVSVSCIVFFLFIEALGAVLAGLFVDELFYF